MLAGLPTNGLVGRGSSAPEVVRRLIGVPALADYLGISPDTLYTMVGRPQVPYIKVGRLLRFDPKMIEQWIAQKSVMPIPQNNS